MDKKDLVLDQGKVSIEGNSVIIVRQEKHK